MIFWHGLQIYFVPNFVSQPAPKTTFLEKCSASIEKLVSLTQESLARFCRNTYNIKHQFECIQHLKSNHPLPLHTGVLYLSGGVLESFASLSDCLRHDAAATWAHLDPVLEYIRDRYPAVTKVHFLSDGPVSQYRNKTAFYLASTVPCLKGFSCITWTFTEASHGKGAPNGAGGALKKS